MSLQSVLSIRKIALRKSLLDWDFVYVGSILKELAQPEGFIT